MLALDMELFDKLINNDFRGAALLLHAFIGAMSKQETSTYTGRYGTRTLGRGSTILLIFQNSLVPAPGIFSDATGRQAVLGLMKFAAVDAHTAVQKRQPCQRCLPWSR